MGTFVVSFIGVGFVNSAMSSPVLRGRLSPVARRRAFVLAFFGVIVCAVAAFGVGTIPDLVREGADFVRRLKSDNIWVVVLEKASFFGLCGVEGEQRRQGRRERGERESTQTARVVLALSTFSHKK
jgi:hypothetical protein